MSALYAAVARRLAVERQRALRREARGGESVRRPSPPLRQSLGRAMIDWGVRLAPEARAVVCDGAPR